MMMMSPSRLGGAAAMVALIALSACSTAPAPNDVAAGVGFSDYQSYQTRRAALGGSTAPLQSQPRAVQTALPPAEVTAQPFGTAPAARPGAGAPSGQPYGTTPSGQAWTLGTPQATTTGATDLASLASAAIEEAERGTSPGPLAVPPASPAPSATPGLPPVTASGDNFVAPPLPEGMAVLGANVVGFALATTNAVGERVHARNPIRLGRPEVRCSDFRTTDLAQDWFLTNDGPERDRAGLDPDGDGFACNWDPERYRAEARAATQPTAAVSAFGTSRTDG